VGAEENLSQPVQRGYQRERQCDPSGGKGGHLPASDPAPETCIAPQSLHTTHIQPGGEEQRNDHERFPAPGTPEVVRRQRLAVVEDGKDGKEGKEGKEGKDEQ
jgi:hypothetical protein